eukprot:gnl/TRDRNA2_/TRDRNA2_158636_c1_seq1.p2 gnl/TRDRNA2_/TRDRNA2_158636_c1~~gnl/TRDRNA2_/TRDRNA2_158636_c1_seq1.p2  ORF type:complete len:161 (+),score=23.77 gnl/TRDRNA2_/TRDRNA2_158636_c1_seq1:1-483(+)
MLSIFRALMGEIEYYELESLGRWMAAIYYISLMIILVLVMFNMLVAILMDVYVNVKGTAGNSRPLYDEAAVAWRRWRELRRGERLGIRTIVESLNSREKTATGFDCIFVQDLMRLQPPVPQEQAVRLLVAACHRAQVEHAKPTDTQQLMTPTPLERRSSR